MDLEDEYEPELHQRMLDLRYCCRSPWNCAPNFRTFCQHLFSLRASGQHSCYWGSCLALPCLVMGFLPFIFFADLGFTPTLCLRCCDTIRISLQGFPATISF